MSLLGSAAVAGSLGALLALDRTAFLQTMASRPLVACALVGAALGEMDVGLRCGLILELLWLMELPVGASVPPDDTLAAVLASSFAAAAPEVWGAEARSALGVMAAVPFGVLGRRLDVVVRKANNRLLQRARFESEGASLAALHLRGAASFAGAGALAAGGGALVGGGLIRELAPGLPAAAVSGLELTAVLLPVVGTGSVLAALRGWRHAALFGAGVGGGLAAQLLTGLGFAGRLPWRR